MAHRPEKPSERDLKILRDMGVSFLNLRDIGSVVSWYVAKEVYDQLRNISVMNHVGRWIYDEV